MRPIGSVTSSDPNSFTAKPRKGRWETSGENQSDTWLRLGSVTEVCLARAASWVHSQHLEKKTDNWKPECHLFFSFIFCFSAFWRNLP